MSYNLVTDLIDKGISVDVALFDLAKEFVQNYLTLYTSDSKLTGDIRNQLDVRSTSKCHVLHYEGNNLHFRYTLNDLPLEAVPKDRDLGVLVDEKLKFDSHAASSANQALGRIKRFISSCSPGVITTLSKALIQPKLEVGMTFVTSFYNKDKFTQEAAQR
ncbi:hypothetical protein QYM36_012144 [Artemia franciscana]|uniref:Uncharacterized protein n=1 Tax=Artemia franciscana TaxID=6661 RepID=A0AA88HF18_ARTSF|nr:hypothetical protein QYM36_012144 [Artemia franciscana]